MKSSNLKIEDVEVRKAIVDDCDGLADLSYEISVLNHREKPEYFKEPQKDDPSRKERLLKRLESSTSVTFVASYNSDIIGMITVVILDREETSSMLPLKVSHLSNFAVKKELQNQGVGKRLMNEVSKWTEAQDGVQEMELNVWQFNVGAIEFYKSRGFQTRKCILSKKL